MAGPPKNIDGLKRIFGENQKLWASHKEPEVVSGKKFLIIGGNSKYFMTATNNSCVCNIFYM